MLSELLKLRVSGNVKFSHYECNNLYYECDDGWKFCVPISETDNATFKAFDKAILFMKWIRRQMSNDELLKKEMNEATYTAQYSKEYT